MATERITTRDATRNIHDHSAPSAESLPKRAKGGYKQCLERRQRTADIVWLRGWLRDVLLWHPNGKIVKFIIKTASLSDLLIKFIRTRHFEKSVTQPCRHIRQLQRLAEKRAEYKQYGQREVQLQTNATTEENHSSRRCAT